MFYIAIIIDEMMYNIQGSIDGMYKLYRCQYWVGKKDKKKKFKIEYV
jgi:hypothetical protein